MKDSPGRCGDSFFFRLLGRRGGPKGAFFKVIKIENGFPNQLFIKVWHWVGPSKNGPRGGFEKTSKIKSENESFLIVLKRLIQNIEKQTLFLILGHSQNDEKTMPKGTSKVMFFDPKWRHGPPRFDVSSDL